MKPLRFSFLFYSTFLFLGIYLDLPTFYSFWEISLIFVLFLFFGFLWNKYIIRPSQWTFIYQVFVFSLLFLIMGVGFKSLTVDYYKKSNAQLEPFLLQKKEMQIDVIITDVIKAKENKSFVGEIIRIDTTPVKAKIALNFSKSKQVLRAGDIITYKGEFKTIRPPRNIGQFDYQQYMNHKGIYVQSYIAHHVKTGSSNYWRYQILDFRAYIINKINGGNEQLYDSSKGILTALLLGEKSFIDAEVMEQFKDVGVMHVLAISGLHVGLIYFVLVNVFFFLPKRIKSIVVLLVLWFFVFLSGFSASVFRAVFMFTIYTVCVLLKRKQSLEHIIGIALFFSLCIYPYWVFDIGFQLSYIAVISIVYILPLFKNYYSKNKLLKYFQGIVYVSVSVQIGLIPIQLYYFKQFSFLFLLANLIVIPLVTLLIVFGILYLGFLWSKDISSAIAFCFNGIVDIMYGLIEKIHRINFLSLEFISLNFYSLVIMCSFIIGFILFIYRKKLSYLVGVILLGMFIQLYELTVLNKQDSEVVIPYSAYKYLSIWVKERRTLNVLSSRLSIADMVEGREIQNYKKHYDFDRIVYHKIEGIIPSSKGNITLIRDGNIDVTYPLDCTIIIMAGYPKINFERLVTINTPELVIFHNSMPLWLKKKCIEICLKKNIPFHDIYEKGYWSSLL